MNVDDIVKLALAFSLLFAIVGMAYELMRLISSVTDTVKSSNKIVDEFGNLSGKLVKDYDYISEQVKFIIGSFSGFAKKVLVPLTSILSVVGKLGNLNVFNRKPKNSKPTEDSEEFTEEYSD